MFTRRGIDWTGKFGPISEALPKLRVDSAILDGEVVTLGKNGVSDFHGLRSQLGTMLPDIVFQAFDLLWLDGEDLRPLLYVERKARLKDILRRGGEIIRYVDYVEGDGAAMLKAACAMGLEGIVSKRLDSAYRGGPSHDWQKTKCEVSETFAVAGYGVDDNGRIDGILLGRVDGGTLRYAGAVDRGLGAGDLAELERRLPPLKVARCPLIEKPTGKSGVRWTRPEVLVEVSYPNKSGDGRLRHPSFKGFRDDLI